MRLSSFLLISSVCLLACSTAAPQSDSNGNTAPSSESGTATDTSASNGAATTTGGPTGTTDSPTTGLMTTGEGTTTPLTSTTGTEGEVTAAPDPSTTGTGTTTDEPDTTTTFGSTTGDTDVPGGPCEVDADCKLHDDCCSCYAIPVDEEHATCDEECLQSKCSELGVTKAVCRLGQCTTEKVDCSSPVLCDSLPPRCEPGTVPGISDGCWSGTCVPVESCDKVPSCDLCPDWTICVEYQAFIVDRVCLPKPSECGDKANCECAGEACVDPFNLCSESNGEADLICSCPNC